MVCDHRRLPGLVRLLGRAPRFPYLWLSRAISATGTGAGRVALVLLAAPSGPAAVSALLLGITLPQLAGPLAGAVADRVDQRRLLAGCEAGQGVVYAVVAAAWPPMAVLLPLVTMAGLLATLMSPAGKSTVARLVPPGQFGGANALLGFALNLQILAGPAIGGALAGLAGLPVVFAVNAASFFASALLLARLGPLPPQAADSAGLLAQTWLGLRYAARSPMLRALVLGTLVFVSFAAVDNVALVFLVKHSLHGSGSEYGAAAAAFGAGMVGASLALGAAGTAATGLAPSIAVACGTQALAGAGNTADLVGTDTLLQQRVPAYLLGRAFGAVYAAAQTASAISYAAAGPLVTLAGPRRAFVIAGAGMLAGLALLVPALRVNSAWYQPAAERCQARDGSQPAPLTKEMPSS